MLGIFIHPVVMSTRNVPGVGSTVVNQLPSHVPPPKGNYCLGGGVRRQAFKK